jgi:hypothetical protein
MLEPMPFGESFLPEFLSPLCGDEKKQETRRGDWFTRCFASRSIAVSDAARLCHGRRALSQHGGTSKHFRDSKSLYRYFSLLEYIVGSHGLKKQDPDTKLNTRFTEFIEQFAHIGQNSMLFPKTCHTCGKEFLSFPEYIHGTEPAKHCLEDCRDVGDGYGTMQYRNCRCGSTLAINFTEDVYPLIDRFWEMIGGEARREGKPVREVVLEFREQCNRYILEEHMHDSD